MNCTIYGQSGKGDSDSRKGATYPRLERRGTYRSAKALGRLGFSASEAIPSLNSSARSKVEWVRDASAEALNRVNANSSSEGN
ncbi:MAG: hypothetical protein VX603_02920 [Gemmatimonadota bacterium]|nr:hypothetical protein [Gemmatimonadota bacterium]